MEALKFGSKEVVYTYSYTGEGDAKAAEETFRRGLAEGRLRYSKEKEHFTIYDADTMQRIAGDY